ncbi:MAG: amino acid ABC transporter substrate-binding protein [Thermoleophilia bacterium]|nr:amino acid ABC transporter substrate-binding protein [Thermoleophilia bacterium]
MRSKRIVILTLVVLVLGLMSAALLSACGDDEETTTSAAPTETTAAPTETTAAPTETTAAPTETTATTVATDGFDGEFVIGAVITLTGAGAMGGAEQKWAYDRAVADINAVGGVNVGGKKLELKLSYVDDKSESTEAAAAVEKLVKAQGLGIILSTQNNAINLAAASTAEKYDAYYHAVVTWTNDVRDAKYEWVSDYFIAPWEAAEVPFNMVELQPEAERPSKWGVLVYDDAEGEGLGMAVQQIAENYPWMEVASPQSFSPGAKDYSSIILKFKQAGVDAIVAHVSPADAITFTKQLKEQNLAPKFMMGWKGFWPTEYAAGLGADSDYVGYDAFWSEDLPYPGAKELGEAYKADHDGLDSVSLGLFYSSAQILAMAIERAGSTDPGAVRDEVFGGTFPGTVMGDVVYDEDGIASLIPLGMQWMDGKRIIIYPDQGHTMEWFKSWDQR